LPAKLSNVIEEYLEAIYRLQERNGIARTGDLVKMLNVAPGTITNTIERLEKDLLVVHEPYKGVQLTEEGRRIAIDVIRRHRLLERLLTDLLEVEWDKAHDIACQLEHWIPRDVAKKIEHVLKNPKTCPHGNPIPTEKGEIFEEKSFPLKDFRVGDKGIIIKIADEKTNFLKYFNKLGIKPGKRIEIIEKAPMGDPIIIKIDGKICAINRSMASSIMIRKIKNGPEGDDQ